MTKTTDKTTRLDDKPAHRIANEVEMQSRQTTSDGCGVDAETDARLSAKTGLLSHQQREKKKAEQKG